MPAVAIFPLTQPIYNCPTCGGLLDVVHAPSILQERTPTSWRDHFASRQGGGAGPSGSGVWRYHRWVLPDLPEQDIVTLGEGATPLTEAKRLSDALGVRLLVKQCGHSLSGSFKDLGMTVLISQVQHMRRIGQHIPAVVCASTGDTSAALAAYGAAAHLRTLVLLPAGKVTAAQLVQPLAHGARVVAIDTDFDGCMEHVQRLANEEGVYLANSKNSLRLEGQKTVALEILQGLDWQAPDWVSIPGGNLGNVAALARGLDMAADAGLRRGTSRLLCAQASEASPLYDAFQTDFAALLPKVAGHTQASAIRIGNPVSYPRAVRALRKYGGVVESVSEAELCAAARQADGFGLYVCPHTAVALGAVVKQIRHGTIAKGATVVVVSTAHGLKFTEFKSALVADEVPDVSLGPAQTPILVKHDYAAVKDAALGR